MKKPKTDKWEKEAQKWMDKLNILDLHILNNIVRYKMKSVHSQTLQSLIKKVEGMRKKYDEWTEANDMQKDIGYNNALSDIIKILEEYES